MNLLKSVVTRVLTWEARIALRRYHPHVIAVTGSIGKTTTKDAIFAALAGHVYVRKSEKSFNSEIGVPLTILGLENAWRNPLLWAVNIVRGFLLVLVYQSYPQWLVLEVGADRPGDIERTARWLKPEIVVLTGVPEVPAHVEYFKSVEDLVREKRSLAEHVRPGGKIVLNADEPRMRELIVDFRGACITYGLETFNEYAGSHEEIMYADERPTGIRFRINHDGSSVPISISGALGRAEIYAALAALAVGDIVGVDQVSVGTSLAEWSPPPGRMRIIEGVRGTVIIDDTYNSSPAAALASLETLKHIGHAKRKIAVLGDMLELGKYSAEAHRSVGARAAECTSVLWTVGFRARAMQEAAVGAGMLESKIRTFDAHESQRAGIELEQELKPGDVVLVKGSQAMRMERVVKAVMASPERAGELLVRQHEEWNKR